MLRMIKLVISPMQLLTLGPRGKRRYTFIITITWLAFRKYLPTTPLEINGNRKRESEKTTAQCHIHQGGHHCW